MPFNECKWFILRESETNYVPSIFLVSNFLTQREKGLQLYTLLFGRKRCCSRKHWSHEINGFSAEKNTSNMKRQG